MNGWHFYFTAFIFIFYHKEEVTSIKQAKRSEHFLFDEDLLVFENVPSRKKRTNVANVLEIGSGSPEGITREDLTTEIITSKSWTISNLVILFPESSKFVKKKNLVRPYIDFSRINMMTLNLLKNISKADEITADWATNDTPKSIEYSLNVYLTWFKLLKNSNDIQEYGNMFEASKNILNSSLPPGFHSTIDSLSFNIMPVNDLPSKKLTSSTLSNYINQNSIFPTESLLFDETTIKNVITTFISESGSSPMMTITQPITQSKITKEEKVFASEIGISSKKMLPITAPEFISPLSPDTHGTTQIEIENVVVIIGSLRNVKLNSTEFEPNLVFSNVTVVACGLLRTLSNADNATGYWSTKTLNGAKSYVLQVKLIFTRLFTNNDELHNVLKTFKFKCAPVIKTVTDLGYRAEIVPEDMNVKVVTNDLGKQQPKSPDDDYTGLIIVIVFPLLGVLTITLLACSICYCWFRTRNSQELNTCNMAPTTSNIPKTSSALSNRSTNQGSSMFIKQAGKGEKTFNQIDNESIIEENSDTGTHSQYRANYPIEFNPQALGDNFFKSLENNVRSSQKQTIVRPQSLFTDSTFSMPTNYYDQTTPYANFQNSKFKKYQIENGDTDKDLIKFDDNEEEDDECGISKYDEFDDDFGEPGEFIEAFNPNVQIPRPKIQIKPLSIFNEKGGADAIGSVTRQVDENKI